MLRDATEAVEILRRPEDVPCEDTEEIEWEMDGDRKCGDRGLPGG